MASAALRGNHRAATIESPPTDLQRPGDIRQVQVRMGLQMRGQIVRCLIERRRRTRRQNQKMLGSG